MQFRRLEGQALDQIAPERLVLLSVSDPRLFPGLVKEVEAEFDKLLDKGDEVEADVLLGVFVDDAWAAFNKVAENKIFGGLADNMRLRFGQAVESFQERREDVLRSDGRPVGPHFDAAAKRYVQALEASRNPAALGRRGGARGSAAVVSRAARFLAEAAKSRAPDSASWEIHVAGKGELVGAIAAKHGITSGVLIRINPFLRFRRKFEIMEGDQLLVPRPAP